MIIYGSRLLDGRTAGAGLRQEGLVVGVKVSALVGAQRDPTCYYTQRRICPIGIKTIIGSAPTM